MHSSYLNCKTHCCLKINYNKLAIHPIPNPNRPKQNTKYIVLIDKKPNLICQELLSFQKKKKIRIRILITHYKIVSRLPVYRDNNYIYIDYIDTIKYNFHSR